MRSVYIVVGALAFIGGCSQDSSYIGKHALPGHQAPIFGERAQPHEPAPQSVEPEFQGKHPVDFYVQAALQRNPEIRARERGVAARAQVVPQVTSLPDPMLADTVYPISNNSIQTAAGRITNSLTLTQTFPWCGKLRLRGEIADQETKIALTQLAATQLKVIEAVKLSYYDIYFNQEAIEITKESEKLLEELFIPFAESRFRTGKTSQQDVLRAQVELNKIQNQLIALRRQMKITQADLAKLLSTSPRADVQVAKLPDLPPLPQHLDSLYQAAVAYRPELQGRLEAIFRDERKIDLAKLNYFPDVTVGASWNSITGAGALSPISNGNDSAGFLFAINLPIWHRKLRAGVFEAQNRTAESARLYEAERDDTFRLIRRFTVQAKTLEEQIKLFQKDLIPRADQTLRISFEDYRVAKTDALQVIDNWLQLLRLRIQLVRLETALGQTLASLERIVGMRLTAVVNGADAAGACLATPIPAHPLRAGPIGDVPMHNANGVEALPTPNPVLDVRE